MRSGYLGFLSTVPEWLFVCGENNFPESGLGSGFYCYGLELEMMRGYISTVRLCRRFVQLGVFFHLKGRMWNHWMGFYF